MKSTLILFFTLILVTFSSSIDAFNSHLEQHEGFLAACCKPLNFTQPRTIHDFLKNVFSNKRYAQDYLPYNMSTHCMQFLEDGKKLKKSAAYMEASLRLFYNKMKECRFFCPETVSEFVDKASKTIKYGAASSAQTDFYADIEKNMMDIFVPTFISDFSLFKSNPEQFLKNIAHNVTLMVKNSFNVHDHVAQEQLKQMFVRIVEQALMKLLWTPNDQYEVWHSVKKISIQCADLLEMNLISPDELDDLYKSLLESFCRFLDLAGSELSLSVIEKIREDVVSDGMLLFEFEEQEQMLETKRERILDVLMGTEAKIEARMRGIITDVVVY